MVEDDTPRNLAANVDQAERRAGAGAAAAHGPQRRALGAQLPYHSVAVPPRGELLWPRGGKKKKGSKRNNILFAFLF